VTAVEPKGGAIFTLTGYSNYGNRLLCCATCKIFASLGVDVEIILVKNVYDTLSFSAKVKRKAKKALGYRFDRMIIKTCRFLAMCLANKYIHCKYGKIIRLRRDRFIAFSAEHIVEKDYGLTETYFPPSFPAEFDFFVVGGDQVWNPFFASVPGTVYFLPFVENDGRAFMFSTSFGISKEAFLAKAAEVPGLLEAYREALSKMRHVSCREDAGAEITNSLAGKGQVLIDPTMMLTRQEWLDIAKEPGFLKACTRGRKGYALTYFLGNFSRALRKKIKEACANENLALVVLNDFADAPAYVSDPAEFVYLAANAQAVYTDSFHGAVFSILLEIPFFVFKRAGDKIDMFSRLDTLLRKCVLEDRWVKNVMDFHPGNGDFTVDFSGTRKILSEERKKAMRFLKTALRSVEYSAPAHLDRGSRNGINGLTEGFDDEGFDDD
jgi:hypothetical protein